MSYRFQLQGRGLRHSWEKECRAEAALDHANQVARECARDETYRGVTIRVADKDGKEVATVPVPERRLK